LFLRRNCSVLHYNDTALQGLTSTVCGKYCCLFVFYTDKGYTPQQFVRLFGNRNIADAKVQRMFAAQFGSLRNVSKGGQCSKGLAA
jgi:hypothetical protein